MFRRSRSGGNRSLPDSAFVGNRSLPDSASGGNRSRSRIHGPSDLKDEFLKGDLKHESAPVLAKIERCYSRMKNLEKFIIGGFCFGLLDPSSNIVINSYMYPDAAPRGAGEGAEAADLIQRSLNGLVAFLATLFPYLPCVEALRYLDAAGADPLAASLLLINNRGMEQSFRIGSETTVKAVETALRCAAVAARHPDPQKLVIGWKLVSPDIKMLVPKVDFTASMLLRTHLVKMMGTADLDPVLQLEESWDLAKSRLLRAKHPALPLARAAKKRMLLSTIHGFYLQALARLPKDELCTRYHHSVLKAGHCYGPLDPVSNIILNTIWYDNTFPPSKPVRIHMISTRCLMRIVARSFYGLVSFLHTRYPDCPIDDVVQRLLVAKADLRVADPTLHDMPEAMRRDNNLGCSGNLLLRGPFKAQAYEATKRSVEGRTTYTSVHVAYAAAATAAYHPAPLEQQELFVSPDTLVKLNLASSALLGSDRALTSHDLELLSRLFPKHPSHQPQQPEHRRLDKAASSLFSHQCRMFWCQHERVHSKVKAAMVKYNINEVHKCRLHFICGVNELGSGPEYSTAKGYNPWTPYKYHHSHINFLATCEDPQSGSAPATLFFAECSNYGIHEESWCIPVNLPHQDTAQVRCIYCEHNGNRIAHPAVKEFHGRAIEFEKVLRGEPLFRGLEREFYSNNRLLVGNAADWVDGLEDDCIYSTDCAADED